eukprot:7929030-Ditylum_brightwellii.AAC.1
MQVVLPDPATEGMVTQFPSRTALITARCSVDGVGRMDCGGGDTLMKLFVLVLAVVASALLTCGNSWRKLEDALMP